MKKRIALICMLIVSVACLSLFAVSCSKPQEKKYTVSYSVESQEYGNVVGTCVSGTKVKKGNSITLTATANSGYSFSGWYEDQTLISNQSIYTFKVEKQTNLVAKFSVMQFALTYSCQTEQGSVESTVNSGDRLDYKTPVSLTATAKAGYTFIGWYENGAQTPICQEMTYSFTMPSNDYSVEAKFSVNSYALNLVFDSEKCEVSITGEGGEPYENGANVPYKTPLTIIVTEKQGYDFVDIVEGQEQVSATSVYSFTMPAKQYDLTINLKAEKRTVQFISQSVIVQTQEVDYNTCATMYQPSRENHEFIGWYTDASLTKLYDFNQKIVENISLYANWEETFKTFTVEFIDWNGKRIDTIQTIKEGEGAIMPATPSREGYNFAGWVCEGDYTCVEQNLVVKASYTIKVYDVKFYKDSANSILYDTQYVNHGELARIPQTILDTDENMLFDKWVDADGLEFNFQTPIVEDLILTATYKQKPISVYQVNFYANGELIDTQLVEENQKATEPSVIALQGQKFVGWNTDITKPITEQTEFVAQFETITFTVRFVDYNQNLIDEQIVNYLESAVAPQNPTRVGYNFIGWDLTFTDVVNDLTITAQYEVLSYVATCYDGTESIGQITADYGQAFAVPETPSKDGFSFDGWYADSEWTVKYDFTLTATQNVSLYAKFDEIVLETFTVKFFVDSTVVSEQEIYSGKDAVAPGVPTKEGHTFIRWEGDFTNVSEDVNVSAIFNKNSFIVNFYEKDKTTLIDSITVYYGEQAIAPIAPTIEGNDFAGWSEDLAFVVEDMEVYALYEKQIVTVYFAQPDGTIMSQGYARYEGNVSIPRTPSKMGYIFTGWYLDEECTIAFDFSSPITQTITLYAGWDKVFDAFTVHFYVNGELYGTIQKVANGKYAIEPALPDGYTVWRVEGTEEIFDFENTPITDNLVLVAYSE